MLGTHDHSSRPHVRRPRQLLQRTGGEDSRRDARYQPRRTRALAHAGGRPRRRRRCRRARRRPASRISTPIRRRSLSARTRGPIIRLNHTHPEPEVIVWRGFRPPAAAPNKDVAHTGRRNSIARTAGGPPPTIARVDRSASRCHAPAGGLQFRLAAPLAASARALVRRSPSVDCRHRATHAAVTSPTVTRSQWQMICPQLVRAGLTERCHGSKVSPSAGSARTRERATPPQVPSAREARGADTAEADVAEIEMLADLVVAVLRAAAGRRTRSPPVEQCRENRRPLSSNPSMPARQAVAVLSSMSSAVGPT